MKESNVSLQSQVPPAPTKPSTYLELGKDPSSSVDYTQIVSQNKKNAQTKAKTPLPQKERENSADFVDDPDVPPLLWSLSVLIISNDMFFCLNTILVYLVW